jgi:hypothetical protein
MGIRSVPASRKIRVGTLEVPDFPKSYNQGTSDYLYGHWDLPTEPQEEQERRGCCEDVEIGDWRVWTETAEGGGLVCEEQDRQWMYRQT